MNKKLDNCVSLDTLKQGQEAVIKSLDGGKHFKDKLINLGVIPGSTVTIISGSKHSPFLLKIGETRVMVGHRMVKRIIVERC